MNTRRIFAIAQKDWIEVRQNKYAWMPMLIVPLLFVVVLPLVFTLILPSLQVDPQDVLSSDQDIEIFIRQMPEAMTQYIDFEKPMESMIVIMLGFLFAPMFLILPMMYSTIIASESFAGERERKTIEALLYTPASDAELLLGKVAAAAIPSLAATWIGFVIYALILNIAPYAYFQRIWFPLPTWWPLILWITPALVVLGIALTVIISARVQNFLGTYQTSASVVLLVVALFAGQITGVLYLSVEVEMLIGAVFWAAAGVLSYYAVKRFNRKALLAGKG
jgi:ABC-type transport system involved in multi-copper enzyme maturation permease subunit